MKKKLAVLGVGLALSVVTAQAAFASPSTGKESSASTSTVTAAATHFDPEAFKELLKSAEKGTYTIVDGKTIIPASSGDATLTAVPLDPEAVQKLLASAKKGKLTVVEGVDVKNLVAAKGITNGTLSFPEGAVKVTGTPIDPATVKKLLQANGKAVETLTAGATQGTLTISSKKLSPELIAQMKELQLKTSKAESTQSTPAETE